MITYQTLFDQLPAPAFMLGPLGEVVLANPSASRLLGLPQGTDQLEQPHTLHVGERWVTLVEQIRDALTGSKATLDLLDPRDPDSGHRIPLLCRPLPDGQGGSMLLCLAASQVGAAGRPNVLDQGHLERIRFSVDPDRTLRNILLVARNALDLDRVLFIQRDFPYPGHASISHESFRTGLGSLTGAFPLLTAELFPQVWQHQRQTLAVSELETLQAPRNITNVLADLQTRSLMLAEVRPAQGISGLLLALSCTQSRSWAPDEVRLFGTMAWAASLGLDAAQRLVTMQGRARWYQVLFEAVVQPPGTPEEVSNEAAHTLLQLCSAQLVLALRSGPGGLEQLAHAGHGPLIDQATAYRTVSELILEHGGSTPWSRELPVPLTVVGAGGKLVPCTHGLCLPSLLLDEQAPAGYLCCLTEGEPQLDAEHMEALRALADRLAATLERARAQEAEQSGRSARAGGALERSATGLAHDFNNILGIITSYASSVEGDLASDSRHRSDLRVVLDAAEQGSRMIRQLARQEAGETPARRPAPLDVVRSLRQLRDLLVRLLPDTLRVELSTQGDLPLISVAEGDLKQVLMHLCIDVQEALQDHGVLSLHAATVTLNKRTASALHPDAKDEAYLFIEVTGRAASGSSRSFDRGRAAGASGTRAAAGHGGVGGAARSRERQLGLVQAAELVRRTGGFLLSSRGLPGAPVHRVHLPLTGTEELRIPSEELPVLGSARPEEAAPAPTILLIDDEPHLRASGERNLSRYGYQVLTAPDGELGVRLYRRFLGRIDLVILDLIMPGMDGRNAFRALKAIDPGVTVLFSSGFASDETLRELQQEGAAGFVAKPYTAKEINRMVRSVLKPG